MEMKRASSAKPRAIGYKPRLRALRVELDDGGMIEYPGVGDEVRGRLAGSSSAWSYDREDIEGDLPGRRLAAMPREESHPFDDLSGKRTRAGSDHVSPQCA